MPKARKRAKKSNGQRKAGRFSLPAEPTQVLAMRILARGLLIIAVCVLASSTLSDPLQKLAMEASAESARVHGAVPMADHLQQERLALLRRTAANADAVRHLSLRELSLLFGEPTLKREEPEAVSWHFTSGECALDVYFPRRAEDGSMQDPVYAEYRVRGQVQEDGLVPGKGRLDHKACVRSLFSHARFPKSGEEINPVSSLRAPAG